MTEYDKAFQNLLEFEASYIKFSGEDLSETDTRSKILDKILIDVLGWSEYDIEREGWVREGYFDYEIRSATFQFVVEAKKSRVHFKLPNKGNEVLLKTIYSGNKDTFDQIRQYVLERGLKMGVITNGNQFIIGQFSTAYGIDWKEQKCIYFKDFHDIKANFIRFYELLSRDSVVTNGTIKISSTSNTGRTIVRDTPLKRKGSELIRNKISQELIPVINQVFEEIYDTDSLDGKKILEKCYIENHDIKKYNSELGSFFADEPPTFDSRILPVQNTRSTQSQLRDQIQESVNNLPDPIILIGTAGAGKTTFIKYFIEFAIDKRFKKNRPIVYLDFRIYTSQLIRDTRFVYAQIISQLEDRYPELNLSKLNVLKTIYADEIAKKLEGTWSHFATDIEKTESAIANLIDERQKDPVQHLQKIAIYLKDKCGKRACIIFDNADQMNEDDQREVFLLGNGINRTLRSIVIISLREGYFYKWRNKPPFNAYQSIVYHITAPPYRDVIRKRIDFVMTQFDFKKLNFQTDSKTLSFQKGSLEHLFKNLYETLFSGKNTDVLEFLEETSYPNTRQGLENFKSFLLSGHSKITEYMSFDYGVGDGIPIWEFFFFIALESNYYYESSKSKIFNLFYPSKSNRNHFTKVRILNHLYYLIKNSSKRKEYTRVEEIAIQFAKAGYTTDVIREEIQDLFDSRLISTSEYAEDIEEEPKIINTSLIAITSVGVFYLRSLLGRFHYIDLVLQDTPIYDPTSFEELSRVFPESDENGNRRLDGRKSSALAFLKYLSAEEKKDRVFIENFDDKIIMFDVCASIKETLARDIDRISGAIVRDSSRP